MDILSLTALELGKMIKERELTAEEAARAALERAKAAELEIHSYVTLDEEGAMRQAAEVQKQIETGNLTGPLAGVPVAVKDNLCIEGQLTTCSSRILSDFKPVYTAEAVMNLQKAGAVIIGKTNMDEFAMGSTTETSFYGPTKNPHNPAHVPGGSSGGSCAAVASGEVFYALGSDTGGSIRLPASYCGIVGLKPTYGSVSRYGLVAFASSLDQIGPLGRSVEDVAMLYSVLCGQDPMDATSARREYGDFYKNLNPGVKGIRIGIPQEYFSEGVSKEVKEKVLAAAKLLEENGAILKEVSLPSTEYALSAYYIISSAEASSNLARFDGVKYGYRTENYTNLLEMYENTRSEGFGDEVKRRILLGTFVLSSGYYDAYYKRAKLLQKQIQAEFNTAFEQCDILLTPTGTDVAFKIGEKLNDPLKMYANDVCTVTVNIAGLPAISLPCGKNSEGMPIGMQLIGPKFAEQRLFDISAAYESLAGGFNEIPTL